MNLFSRQLEGMGRGGEGMGREGRVMEGRESSIANI